MNCEQSTFDILLETLGREKLDDLRAAFGGRDFFPPKRVEGLSDDHPLVKALGMTAARSLVEAMCGARFYVPMPPEMTDRDRSYTRLKAEGLSNREIAKRLGVTERPVRRALARCGMTPNDGWKKSRKARAAQRPADGLVAPVSTPNTQKPEMAC